MVVVPDRKGLKMENIQNQEGLTVDLRQVAKALFKRAWLIGMVAVLSGALLLSIAVFLKSPTYAANVQLYVNNNESNSIISASQVAAAQALADTYLVVLESRSVLAEVQQQTRLPYTYNELKQMVVGEAINGTEVIQVTVTCGNYMHAAQIANAIADVMPNKISAVIQGSSVRVIDYAVEDPNPVGPSYGAWLVVGVAAGMLLSAVFVIVSELLDTSIHSEDYLSEIYGYIPLLAVIPNVQSERNSGKGYYESKMKAASKQKTGGAK